VCCNVSPIVPPSPRSIAFTGPETLPVMVLPVISTWSEVFLVARAETEAADSPMTGDSTIASFWMFVITMLLMVMLENVVPVAADGRLIRTQIPQFWRASP